ncbi:MAG: hypothetical protein GY925_26375 [Actinomycetia bacterium]|nr:hypothetical protein [Actinomycetes bacterium]
MTVHLEDMVDGIESDLAALTISDTIHTSVSGFTILGRGLGKDPAEHENLGLWLDVPSTSNEGHYSDSPEDDAYGMDDLVVTLRYRLGTSEDRRPAYAQAMAHERTIRETVVRSTDARGWRARWSGARRTRSTNGAWYDIAQRFGVSRDVSL